MWSAPCSGGGALTHHIWAPGTHVAFPHVDSTVAIDFFCTLSKSTPWLVSLGDQFRKPAKLRSTRAPKNHPPQEKHRGRATPIFGPIHDVFVDTHRFESRPELHSNDRRSSYTQQRAHPLATVSRSALLAEFAHWCTPVTTCIPPSDTGPHARPLLTTTSCVWSRERRWLQAVLETLRWWCE